MRTATYTTQEAVEAAVMRLLDEHGCPAPISSEEFRRAVTVRALRARLGGGDRDRLTRLLLDIEQRIVQRGQSAFHVMQAPAPLAELFRDLWTHAVAMARREVEDVARQGAEAQDAADRALANALARIEMLRTELHDTQVKLSQRDTANGEFSARLETGDARVAALTTRAEQLERLLDTARSEQKQQAREHAGQLDALRATYDGERRHLMAMTDEQRRQQAGEIETLKEQLKRSAQAMSGVESALRMVEAEYQRLREARVADPAAERSGPARP